MKGIGRVSLRGLLTAGGLAGISLLVGVGFSVALARGAHHQPSIAHFNEAIEDNADNQLEQGRQTFRFDTFGDEVFWGDTIKLHRAIEGEKHGGVGPGVSPATALAVGLKVDVEALPETLQEQIRLGQVDLNDPATTLALLQLNAVVGVTGFSDDGFKSLRSIGIQCALCHSTVDNSFAPGIGHRLDGFGARDLNVGAIVNLAPDLSAVDKLLFPDLPQAEADAIVRKVLNSWGPGKFDAEVFLDGKAFQPDGRSAATLIPPALGLAGVNLHTWTGWGSVTYWNAFVANLEMHGVGTFFDTRLDNAAQFPVAARARMGHTTPPPGQEDRITSKLAALHFYQLAIPAPEPPEGSFDPVAAERGKAVFESAQARCASCHVPPLFSEPGWNLHPGSEIGIDNFQADRSPTHMYRTSPLKGLWAHAKGGFFHDGRFADLRAVVDHYDSFFKSGLTEQQKNDLVEYLKSI